MLQLQLRLWPQRLRAPRQPQLQLLPTLQLQLLRPQWHPLMLQLQLLRPWPQRLHALKQQQQLQHLPMLQRQLRLWPQRLHALRQRRPQHPLTLQRLLLLQVHQLQVDLQVDLVILFQCGQAMESRITRVNVYVTMDKHTKFLHVTHLKPTGVQALKLVCGRLLTVVLQRTPRQVMIKFRILTRKYKHGIKALIYCIC